VIDVRHRFGVRRRPAVLALALVLLVGGVGGSLVLWRRQHSGQASGIPAERSSDISAPWPTPSVPGTPRPAGRRFVTSVSADGRHFRDQYGDPLLVHGDSPWSLMTDLSPSQAELYFRNRQEHGFNAAIISLIGAVANGGPADDGTTFDGLGPFVDGDVTRWQEPYWDRVTHYLALAADHGITAFLYPIDGWTIGHAFKPHSIEQCQAYGAMVAERFRDLHNIVWMSGGDYFPRTDQPALGSDVDHCIDAMMRGIRAAGDARPFSIQLGYPKSISTDNPYWADRVTWNFVYSYLPTYRAVLQAYARTPTMPAVFGEGNYEGENNDPDTPDTTPHTLRQQLLWSLTSGAAGEFYGIYVWEFLPCWENRLDSESVAQFSRLRELFDGLRWWNLVPDTGSALVTAGRGTEVTDDQRLDVLENDYVTAARSADGRLAVIYLPGAHTISLDRAVLADAAKATWIDPGSGERHPVPMADTFTTPGRNASGDQDWLLLITAP
jgi:hypothetical protein